MTRIFQLAIELENSSFDDDEAGEIARILREVATRNIEGSGAPMLPQSTKIYDANGNHVGNFTWSPFPG